MGENKNSDRQKCGNILINIKTIKNKNKIFTFHCAFCSTDCDQLKKFAKHLEEHLHHFEEAAHTEEHVKRPIIVFEPEEIKVEEPLDIDVINEGCKKIVNSSTSSEVYEDPLETRKSEKNLLKNLCSIEDFVITDVKNEPEEIVNDDVESQNVAHDNTNCIQEADKIIEETTKNIKKRYSVIFTDSSSDEFFDDSNDTDFDVELNTTKTAQKMKKKTKKQKTSKNKKKSANETSDVNVDDDVNKLSNTNKPKRRRRLSNMAEEDNTNFNNLFQNSNNFTTHQTVFNNLFSEGQQVIHGESVTFEGMVTKFSKVIEPMFIRLTNEMNSLRQEIKGLRSEIKELKKDELDVKFVIPHSPYKIMEEFLKFEKLLQDDKNFFKSFIIIEEILPYLIKQYKKYEILWQVDHISFGVKNKKYEIYAKIVEELKLEQDVNICLEDINYHMNYLNELYSKDKEEELRCKMEEKEFVAEYELYTQMSFLSDSQGPFICVICKEMLPKYDSYCQHMAQHNGTQPYKCPSCDMTFTNYHKYLTHKKRHLGIFNFHCDICGKGYLFKNDLEWHVTSHTGDKPYLCQICGTGFRARHGYDNHVRRHEERFRYECHICKRGFNHLHALNNHVKSHLNIRDIICNICGKGFVHNKYLKRHQLIHGDVKNYKCNECGKAFFQSCGLRAHRKNHHS